MKWVARNRRTEPLGGCLVEKEGNLMLRSLRDRSFSSTLLVASKRPISFFTQFCWVVLQIRFARRVGVDCPKPNRPVEEHIWPKSKEAVCSAGLLGCPTSNAMQTDEGTGVYQTFERGIIGWTPSAIAASIQAEYVKAQDLQVERSQVPRFDDTAWLVGWNLGDQNVEQQTSGSNGAWISKDFEPQELCLVVEGVLPAWMIQRVEMILRLSQACLSKAASPPEPAAIDSPSNTQWATSESIPCLSTKHGSDHTARLEIQLAPMREDASPVFVDADSAAEQEPRQVAERLAGSW